MVFEERSFPHCPRSAKRARSMRKQGRWICVAAAAGHPEDDDNNPMSAFNMLAMVAGDVLTGEKDADKQQRTKAEVFTPLRLNLRKIGSSPDMYSMLELRELDEKPPPLVSSDSSGGAPLCSKKSVHRSSLFLSDGIIGDSDDEYECSSRCSCRYAMTSGELKISVSKSQNDLCCTGSKGRHARRSKRGRPQQRAEKINNVKRRKVFNACPIDDVVKESSPNSDLEQDAQVRENQVRNLSDQRVKLNIKSFRVPELRIEIPENATFASLKQTVLDALMTLLGNNLSVGVSLEGEEVRDDRKTLVQAGIYQKDNLENLGFSLEPNAPCDKLILDDADITEQLACMLPPPSESHKHEASKADCNSCGTNISLRKADLVDSSRAIVPVQPANREASLAIVPLRKARKREQGQRRVRRPFSVSEVEALVQAVERLGTGRWRDVKLQAFDNAKHRTYVDLKDKWKTLVHTASILPQQRRGEPVPQHLLDRVLSVQAYWSQQQNKLMLNKLPLPEETC